MGTIKGTPPPANEVVRPAATWSIPDLVTSRPGAAAERYSFIFDGNAQQLDHALTN